MQTRSYSSGAYRFAFNGKEKEADGTEGNYDFGARIYDGRLGRWLAVDPYYKLYARWSPFEFGLNIPTIVVDYDGRDLYVMINDVKGNVMDDARAKSFCQVLNSGFDNLVKFSLDKNPVMVKSATVDVASNVYKLKMEIDQEAVRKLAISKLSPSDATNEDKINAEVAKITQAIGSNPIYKGLDGIINKPIQNDKGKNVNEVVILYNEISGAQIAAAHTPLGLDMQDIIGTGKCDGHNFAFALLLHEIVEDVGYSSGYHRNANVKKQWANLSDPYPSNHFDNGLMAESQALNVDFAINSESKERDGGAETGNGFIRVITYKKMGSGKSSYYEKKEYHINYSNHRITNTESIGKTINITNHQFLKDVKEEKGKLMSGRK